MPISENAYVELVGELTAYRSAYLFLLKALEASLSGINEPTRTLLVESIEGKLVDRRGELLHVAPLELSADLQAICNRAMQENFSRFSEEISRGLRAGRNE